MRSQRNAFLLPYMNREALVGEAPLLLSLLYNRVNHSPEQRFLYDNSLLELPWRLGAFDLSYNGQSIVMHGPDYGMVTAWEEERAHALDQLAFPRGILVLEAQAKLSKTLVGIVQRLVEGLDSEGPPENLEAFGTAIRLGFKNETGTQSVLGGSSYLYQPYSAPPVFDLSSLLALAQGQVNFHADYLWLLQTDPPSLRRYASFVVNGELGENMDKPGQYVHIVKRLVIDVQTYYQWQWIVEEILSIKQIHSEVRRQIVLGQPLPPAFDLALSSLEALLERTIVIQAPQIASFVFSSPGFRDKWTAKHIWVGKALRSEYSRRKWTSPQELFFEDRPDFCLSYCQS